MADVEYREFPLMRRSSFAHFVEMTYVNFEAVRTASRRITEVVIDEMLVECHEHGIPMVFAFIDGKKYLSDYAPRAGIVTVDMSVDLSLPENTNTPRDGRPSAFAHQHYAETITAVLREVLSERAARP